MSQGWVVASCLLALGIAGCCGGGGTDAKKLPSSVPIYPGAKLSSADTTLGVSNFTYGTADEGQKVRDWYSAQSGANWTASCGADWKKRTEMLGMRFDYRCFKSKAADGYFRVEVGDNPSKPPRVIRVRHCPASRVDRCGDKP